MIINVRDPVVQMALCEILGITHGPNSFDILRHSKDLLPEAVKENQLFFEMRLRQLRAENIVGVRGIADADKALEYLVLDSEAKMKYLESRHMTPESWLSQFSVALFDGEHVLAREISEVLGIDVKTVRKAWCKDKLGEVVTLGEKHNAPRGVSSGVVNKIIESILHHVPVPAIHEELDNGWYLTPSGFDQRYSNLYAHIAVPQTAFLSFDNTNRIFKELREERTKIDDWQPLANVYKVLGIELTPQQYMDRRKALKSKGIKPEKVRVKTQQGVVNTLEWKVAPEEFQVAVEHEEAYFAERKRVTSEMVPTKYFIDRAGMGGRPAVRALEGAEVEGLIKRTTTLKSNGKPLVHLWPKDKIDLLLAGKLKPSLPEKPDYKGMNQVQKFNVRYGRD